jgi:hypothetical protein
VNALAFTLSVITAVAIALSILFAIVVHGIRSEVPDAELPTRAPSLTARIVRRILGVYVIRPATTEDRRDDCFAGKGR